MSGRACRRIHEERASLTEHEHEHEVRSRGRALVLLHISLFPTTMAIQRVNPRIQLKGSLFILFFWLEHPFVIDALTVMHTPPHAFSPAHHPQPATIPPSSQQKDRAMYNLGSPLQRCEMTSQATSLESARSAHHLSPPVLPSKRDGAKRQNSKPASGGR